MNTHELIFYIALLAVGWTFISSVMGARQAKRYLNEVTQRAKELIETASTDQDRLEKHSSVAREHLQVTKELLSEIKALRSDLARNQTKNA